jgi:hypothetical protein
MHQLCLIRIRLGITTWATTAGLQRKSCKIFDFALGKRTVRQFTITILASDPHEPVDSYSPRGSQVKVLSRPGVLMGRLQRSALTAAQRIFGENGVFRRLISLNYQKLTNAR